MLSVGLTEGAGITSDLLGGKGAGLANLSRLGFATPPAFILTSEAYHRWRDAGFRIDDDLCVLIADRLDQLLSQAEASGFLATEPFLISVRSSPTVSMPGMLSSILNVGVTLGWLDSQPNSFRLELFAEFVRTYLLASDADYARAIALGVKQVGEESSASLRKASRHTPVNETLLGQVTACVDAVFRSGMRQNVAEFAAQRLLGEQMPIAAVVQVMVYGNRSDESASGVFWNRDIHTGDRPCTGTYLVKAQGPQVVGSTDAREARSLIEMKAEWPEVYEEICQISDTLDTAFLHAQEVEFTVDDRRLWLLQTRDVPLSPLASIRRACSKVDSGAWTPTQAVLQTRADALPSLNNRVASAPLYTSTTLLARGIPASGGVATGPLVIKPEEADRSPIPDNAILIAESLTPQDDFDLMKSCAGFVSLHGGPGTHTASLLRKLGKPYVVSLDRDTSLPRSDPFVLFGPNRVQEGETVTILGSRGELIHGELLESEDAAAPEQVERFRGWMRKHGSMSPWQVFNYPGQDADHNIKDKVGSVARRQTWKSEKAVVTDLLRLVPEEWRIEQKVFAADDRETIRTAMLSGVEAGFWIGPKVCRTTDPYLGNGPWQTGIKTAEEVDAFLKDPAYVGLGPHGGYLTWINDPAVTELIVVFDPPGKGAPELNAEHFVCTLSCVSSPAQLQIMLMLGTSRLRSLESASPRQVILVIVEPDYLHPHYLGIVRPIVGRDYWTSLRPGRLFEVAMSRGDCSFRRLRGLVHDRSLAIAEQVTRLIMQELWRPPFDLPHYMIALDDEFGLETLEFQGRADGNGRIAFFKLFDAKGHEEQLFVNRA